jgi:hypothetical protein
LFSILSLLTALFLTYISYFLVLPYMAAFDIFYLWEYTWPTITLLLLIAYLLVIWFTFIWFFLFYL